jgi:glycosyltransferase involved in cell wall biosynthesis
MAVYNGDRFLAESLRTILSQDMDDYDVVLVDDGSTDQTAQIIEQFNDPKIRYLKQANGGLVSALNFGISHLDCDYVARIDDDDICYPNRLSAQLDFITFTKASAVACRVMNIDTAGKPRGVSSHLENLLNANAGFLPAREPYLPHPFMMIDRSVLDDIGGYRDAHLAEDADLCWRLYDNHRLALSETPLGQYRIHSQSISSKSPNFGRVQAFYAQLAALNFQRRAANRVEVPYDLTMAEAREMATSIPNLVDHVSDHLSDIENIHLSTAAGLKLLDLGNWRDYQLTLDDYNNTMTSYENISGLPYANRHSIEQTTTEALAKLEARIATPELKTPSWRQRVGDRVFGKR